jgi:hypothetical protein
MQSLLVDLGGIEHAVEVSAGSLYEAVAQALRIFREINGLKVLSAVRRRSQLR